ncbi:hypothetical protein SAMN06265222_110169 [Neorhodopirellula lusitana]|uniref:Uncharacterized protein n=1 Tax=Neorhodopirellula lusitana TaxID=445327 RepID=A0ABY1QCM5_9BACT|nr:hypothetical protein SAMN06265222_110169 [Neorhodopirellula lusitana]
MDDTLFKDDRSVALCRLAESNHVRLRLPQGGYLDIGIRLCRR